MTQSPSPILGHHIFDGVRGYFASEYIDLLNYDRDRDDYIFSSFRNNFVFEFEIPLTAHCNLNCKMCTAYSPLARKSYLTKEIFLADMQRIYEIFGSDLVWVRLVGGEPLLHKDIIYFLIGARKIFPRSMISITTNGILLNAMDEVFFEVCKNNNIIILVSPYPVVNADKIISSMRSKNIICFKTVKKFTSRFTGLDLEGKQDPVEAFARCKLKCNFLLDGRICKCYKPLLIKHFNDYFHKQLHVSAHDTICIHEHSRDEILVFLNNPISFCRYCDNSKFLYSDWAHSKLSMSEWVSTSE